MTSVLWIKGLCLAVMIVMASSVSAIAQQGNIRIEREKGIMIPLPRPAQSVMVSSPDIAGVEVKTPTRIYVFGMRVGQTSLYVLDQEGNTMYSRTVEVTHNLSGLVSAVQSVLPNVKVRFRSIDRGLVMEGESPSPREAQVLQQLAASYLAEGEQLIDMTTVQQSDQVTLRVRIAEVARSELQNFGINLQSLLTDGNILFGVATGRNFFNQMGQRITDGTNYGMFGQYSDANFTIDGFIDLLERDGLVNVLAEPNLTARSGTTANFLAGGEIPIPVQGEDGAVSITYREFGVGLDFTPNVISRDRIQLDVAPEVSSISSIGAVQQNNFDIPSFSTRRASTSVELANGESLVIAGLLQNTLDESISQLPWIGDIPILGALFRSTSYQEDETELMIGVTPYVVRSAPETEIALPTDGFKPASLMERVLYGKMYRNPPTHGALEQSLELLGNAPRLHGDIGFEME